MEENFFAGLQSGRPGVYSLNRELTEKERQLVPSPSKTYFIEGNTHVQIFQSAEECLKDPKEEARRQLHEGIQAIMKSDVFKP